MPSKKYHHKRQRKPEEFIKNGMETSKGKKANFLTVPLYKAPYSGKKYSPYKKRGSGAKARIGKHRKSGKTLVQVILLPKKNALILNPTKPDKVFDKPQLDAGTEVEYEHTPVKRIATEIAKHHIQEYPKKVDGKIGSDYYPELKKMEKKLSKKKK